MVKHWGMVSLAATLAACSAGVSTADLPTVVRGINAGEADHLFEEMPGVEVSARIDEGNTLVLKARNLPTGNQTYDPNRMRAELRPEVCADGAFRKLIDEGGRLRFEMVSNTGKELPAIQFARC